MSTSQTGFLRFLGPEVGPHFGVPKMEPKMGVKCVKHIRRPPFWGPFLVPQNGGHFLGQKPAFVWTGGGILPMDQCSFVCLQEAVPHCEHGRS